MAEEHIWIDLRNLMQMGVAHIRNQKLKRARHFGVSFENEEKNANEKEDGISANHALKLLESPEKGMSVTKASLPPPPNYHDFYPPPQCGEFPQPSYVLLLFMFLLSLCSDRDETLQTYLTRQSDNFQNVDMLRESAVYLRMIDDFCHADTVDIIQTVILFLQEAAIGSRPNQVWNILCFLTSYLHNHFLCFR